MLKELQALREERTQLQAELEKYRECDPEVVEEMSEYSYRPTGFSKKVTFKLLHQSHHLQLLMGGMEPHVKL